MIISTLFKWAYKMVIRVEVLPKHSTVAQRRSDGCFTSQPTSSPNSHLRATVLAVVISVCPGGLRATRKGKGTVEALTVPA